MAFTYNTFLLGTATIIVIAGSAAYIRDTLKGTTKPNRVTWLMWALAPLIGVGAALSAHADPWAAFRIFLTGFLPLIIFCASFFNPQSYWKASRFDLCCGGASLCALIAWWYIGEPLAAIVFAIVADIFASIPTLVKAWKYPETETGATFLAGLLSILLVVPIIPSWDIPNAGFQVYIIVVDTLLVLFIYRVRLLKLCGRS